MKMFAAIALAMGFVSGAMAQGQSKAATIVGKAIVSTQVEVTAGTPLDFKNVAPGVTKTIIFNGSVTAGTATTGETAGHFFITKGVNTNVTLNFTALPNKLVGINDAAGEFLDITYTAQIYKSTLTAYSLGTPTAASSFSIENSGSTAPYYATDVFQLDLGGSVSPLSTQLAGDYQSDITLTATYN